MALEVWGIDPVVIAETWTDELFTLMFVARLRGHRRRQQMRAEAGEPDTVVEPTKRVSDQELFSIMGI